LSRDRGRRHGCHAEDHGSVFGSAQEPFFTKTSPSSVWTSTCCRSKETRSPVTTTMLSRVRSFFGLVLKRHGRD
jgi:hypothetical protein